MISPNLFAILNKQPERDTLEERLQAFLSAGGHIERLPRIPESSREGEPSDTSCGTPTS